MPILTEAGVEQAARRVYRLAGLPDFNVSASYVISRFDGLRSRSAPDTILVANGGGAGAVAVGAWLQREKYYTLVGMIQAPARADMLTLLSLLHAALPASHESTIEVLDTLAGRDMQVFVRNYDEPEITFAGPRINFTFPLVAPDPFKYALTEISASAGGFAVTDAYRTYEAAGAHRLYEAAGSYRFYTGEEDDSSLPKVASLSSDGDATSERMTITVSGPLTSGEWWVEDADGTRLWAEVSAVAGQTVTFDCRTRTATLDGAPIDHLVFGDYLSLAPGENAYRLIVGASGAGSHMTITALEAYQ